MECFSRPDSTHIRLVAFKDTAKSSQSSICSYLVLLFTEHTLSHYRLASYHLAMASYASCSANSAGTFFLAKEKIPGSSLDYLDEFFYWCGDRARKSPENKFLGYCC